MRSSRAREETIDEEREGGVQHIGESLHLRGGEHRCIRNSVSPTIAQTVGGWRIGSGHARYNRPCSLATADGAGICGTPLL